jgi:cation transport ATPase
LTAKNSAAFAKADPGVLVVTDDRVFGPGNTPMARRFARRVLAFREVSSLALDPARATATLNYRPPLVDRGTFPIRLAAAVAGDIEGLDETELPHWAEDEAVTLYRYPGVVSLFDELNVANGRLTGRHATLSGNPATANWIETALRVLAGVTEAKVIAAKAELLVCFDPHKVAPARLIRIAEAELRRRESAPTVAAPEPVDFRLENVTLGVAALGQFVLPLAAPIASGLLVLANLGTFGAAAVQLRERKIGLPLLYSCAVGTRLSAGQFLAASVLSWFFRYWESRYRRDLAVESRALIEETAALSERARVLTADGLVRLVRRPEVAAGQQIRALAGELVPVDGRVLTGAALVDEGVLDGKSAPVRRVTGDTVLAGSRLLAGTVDIETLRTGSDTRAARIARTLLATTVPPPRRWALNADAENFAGRTVTPTLLTAGAGLAIGDVTTAGAILSPDYATGVGVAVPLETLRAVRFAVRKGAVLRAGDAFARLAAASWIILDDHEALHRPGCEVAEMRSKLDEVRLLPAIAAAGSWLGDERGPALAQACRDRGLVVRRAECREIAGDGVAILYGGHLVRLHGRSVGAGAAPPPLIVEVDGIEVAGIRFGRHGPLAATAAIRQLQRDGRRVFLASELPPDAAALLARQLGVDMHCGRMSVDRKILLLRKLRQQRVAAAFVGDHATGARVTREAHLAIALAGEDALWSQAWDVALLGSSIEPLPALFSLAHDHTRRIARARHTVMAPNLLSVAGAFSFGLSGLAAVLISNFGTSMVYNGTMRSLRGAREPLSPWRGARWYSGPRNRADPGEPSAWRRGSEGRRIMNDQGPGHRNEAVPSEEAEGAGSPAEGASDCPPPATPQLATQTAEQIQAVQAIDAQLIQRIENLPREAGWALIVAGVIGVVAPGIIGAPFVVAGAFVLTPGGPRLLSRWAGRKPRKRVHSALRQMCRMIDDLDRRYPIVRGGSPATLVEHGG